MFSIAKLFAVALAATTVVTAATTPQQVVECFRALTHNAKSLERTAQSISVINAPLIVIGQGPFAVIISGFSDQVQIGNTLIELLDNGFTELTRADEDLVFYAYEEFSRAEKATLNILIVKAGIAEQVPMVGPPVAAVLRQVKEVVASISNTLIQNIQSRAKDFESEAKSLGDTLDLAISKYDGLAQAQ
ncbi:hypothetical protein V501_10193 [Pseudogymnoascus sp. VKM F-4519 (FW-2642)]|nr:hypothetical protein V501_10193 [Pseudogymnoascus sp. VKM F-4519 (FW-2642)]